MKDSRDDSAISGQAQTETDSATRRLLGVLFGTVFLALAVGPLAVDVSREVNLRVWFGGRLNVTIPPAPDRLSSDWVLGTDLGTALNQAKKLGTEEAAVGSSEEPLTFWQRILFVWRKFDEWIHSTSQSQASLQRQVMFAALAALLAFMAAARVYGARRVSAFLSGLIGADRIKKLIIDIFLLKGVERQLFPSIKTTLTRTNIIASTSINRIDLHDIIRVSVGLQGDGRIEGLRESLTVEGRAAYTYCPGLTGSGGDYYFNLAKITTRSVRITGDFGLYAASQKGHVGRVKFDITGFKASAWE